jgi:hypothetical protein
MQPLNIFSFIIIKPDGRTIDTKLKQFLKANSPMLCNALFSFTKLTAVKLMHSENAYVPIVFTEAGIIMLCKLVQIEKA